jgi:hypothetical protein
MYLILKILLWFNGWAVHTSQKTCISSNTTVRTSNFVCVIVLIRLLQFSRITASFQLWVKWYFHLQDLVHLHIEPRNIHILTQVYSFISDPPKDAFTKTWECARTLIQCMLMWVLTHNSYWYNQKSKCLTRKWKGTSIKFPIIHFCQWCCHHIKQSQFSSKIPLGHHCYASVLSLKFTWCSFTKINASKEMSKVTNIEGRECEDL